MKDYEIQNVLPFIIDYLDNPSIDDESDCKRRGNLYKLLNLKYDEKKKTCPYLTGPLGEEIIEIYYSLQNIPYDRKQKVKSSRSKGYHKPDGLENEKYFVEVKMRAYHSEGTAHEKIPSIAFKYGTLPKKLKIYLLADDEHKYNTYWSKLLRNEISPLNEFEKKYKDSHYLMIEQIVYGTDVSNLMKDYVNKKES